MGIATGTFQLLLKEHRVRPFLGKILTLGKQDIYLTNADVRFWTSYYNVQCEEIEKPELSSKPEFSKHEYLSDRGLFSLLGAHVESLDISSYEGCDHIADLNLSEPPSALEEQYDVVLDLGTLEHIFHLPNAFRFCYGLLKENGRMIHMSPLSNYPDHGFYMLSPRMFQNYYETSNWKIHQIKIIRHSRNHDIEPYWTTDYAPDYFACLNFGGLDDFMYQTFAVVEKRHNSTGFQIPQQKNPLFQYMG